MHCLSLTAVHTVSTKMNLVTPVKPKLKALKVIDLREVFLPK